MANFNNLYEKLRKLVSPGDEIVETSEVTPVQKNEPTKQPQNKVPKLVEGVDFYWEGHYMVLTSEYLLNRGYCCESGCRHCPYGFKRKLK